MGGCGWDFTPLGKSRWFPSSTFRSPPERPPPLADWTLARIAVHFPTTKKCPEVYRKPGATGSFETTAVAAPAVLECAALPGVRVDLAALFA